MGASAWVYKTPYQADFAAALQRLRQEVFDTGEYYQCWRNGGADPEMFPPEFFQPDELERLLSADPPADIGEALLRSMPDGTHSVLDVSTLSSEPGFQVVTTLSDDSLRGLFETAQPTADDIEDHKVELWDRLVRWSSLCVVAYQDGQPSSLFFLGVSGD